MHILIKNSAKMKLYPLFLIVVSLSTIHAFTGMIFTPKAGFTSNSAPIASTNAKILSKCWVSNHTSL